MLGRSATEERKKEKKLSVTLCGLLSNSDLHYADVLSKEYSFTVAQPPSSRDSIPR